MDRGLARRRGRPSIAAAGVLQIRTGVLSGSLAILAGLCLIGVAACSRHESAAQTPAVGARQTPSGPPVPRYVSLKFDKVNARGGPGDDYDLKWVYRVKGLPLQVVAETEEWRRVCDAQGALSWVHRRTTDARRTVMRTDASPVAMRAQPTDAAAETALLSGHAIADLKSCQGDWCHITVGHTAGWVHATDVWGLAPEPQCR